MVLSIMEVKMVTNFLKTFQYCKVHHVFQQTGFKRAKRGYKPLFDNDYEVMDSLVNGPKSMEKKNSWSELRSSLDLEDINPAVVHPENYFEELQHQHGQEKEKRGYNPLKVGEHIKIIPKNYLNELFHC